VRHGRAKPVVVSDRATTGVAACRAPRMTLCAGPPTVPRVGRLGRYQRATDARRCRFDRTTANRPLTACVT